MSKINISRQIENLSSYKNYSKQQILKEIYDHTINQKKQDGILSTIQIREILHILNRDDIRVIDEIDYWQKAINNKEPKEAIIFHHNKNTSIGHWVCAYTDKNNVIHYDNSFGTIPPIDISNRTILYDKSQEQSADSTSCGWYSLLSILNHGKIKSKPF